MTIRFPGPKKDFSLLQRVQIFTGLLMTSYSVGMGGFVHGGKAAEG